MDLSHDLQLRRNQPQSSVKGLKTTKASYRNISFVRHPIKVIPVPMDSERRDEENLAFFISQSWPEHHHP
ncbi:hypothetical protein L484_004249 [Morus notabilis]|uniref:Uncharacterized protein n=1 Tax=Morus notabilis TaxID=981085 RepID=W9RQK5_9ROSA|nr:hypothetical protein L484_004249 [Morus notabilis]